MSFARGNRGKKFQEPELSNSARGIDIKKLLRRGGGCRLQGQTWILTILPLCLCNTLSLVEQSQQMALDDAQEK